MSSVHVIRKGEEGAHPIVSNLVKMPRDNRSVMRRIVEKIPDAAARKRFIDELVKEKYPEHGMAGLKYDWEMWARPSQLIPHDFNNIWSTYVLNAGRGLGKLIPIDEVLPTPNGWSTMEDIKIGDSVFDENGNICKVISVSNITIPEKAYKFKFSDNTEIVSCSEHQWVTWQHRDRKAYIRQDSHIKEAPNKYPDDWVSWSKSKILSTSRGKKVDEKVLSAALEEYNNSKISIRKLSKKYKICEAYLNKAKKGKIKLSPTIYGKNDDIGPKIRTTQQIVDTFTFGKRNDNNHSIPLCRALKLPEIDLPIDPYCLGLFYGDGTAATGEITCHIDDYKFYKEYLEAKNLIISELKLDKSKGRSGFTGRFKIEGLAQLLKNNGVLKTKKVLDIYKRGSVEQRLSLLQGLFDSDATASADGFIEFCNTNEALADLVFELLISLGQKPTRHIKQGALYGVSKKLVHRIFFTPINYTFFALPRKVRRCKTNTVSLKQHHRMLIAYEEVAPTPMKCITVDSKNSMYLVGRQMLPTHNTKSSSQWVISLAEKYPGCRIAMVGATTNDVIKTMVSGEALDINEDIPTLDGFKKMKDIKVGDYVFSADGSPTRVTWVSDIYENRKCYEITFDNGYKVIADAQHKWASWIKERRGRNSHLGHKVLTTEQMKQTLLSGGAFNHAIKIAEPVQYSEKILPIPPFVLGAWTGDGANRGGQFTSADEEIIKNIRDCGFEVSKWKDKYGWNIKKLTKRLKELGVLYNKHIPEIYLYSSIEQRKSLLQGLMSTDGYIDKNGMCYFYSIYPRLIENVKELAESLGLRVSEIFTKSQENHAFKEKGYNVKPVHVISFAPKFDCFKLARKTSRIKSASKKSRWINIHKIEEVSSVPVKCFAVEHPSQLYLFSKRYIVTHNSGVIESSPEWFKPQWNPTYQQLKWANGSIASYYTSEKPDRLRGPNHHFAWADEVTSWRYAEDTFDMLSYTLRIGENPRTLVSTTPKNIEFYKKLLGLPTTWTYIGSTFENQDNLSKKFLTEMMDRYAGTRLGLQELEAEILADDENALWKRDWIDRNRILTRVDASGEIVPRDEILPDFIHVVLAIDPAVSVNKKSAETAITVAAFGDDGKYYVLYADSFKDTPEAWARRVYELYDQYLCDSIVIETNQGGNLVISNLKQTGRQAPITEVRARRGKMLRAEPIAGLYERNMVRHFGILQKAESQMCNFNQHVNKGGLCDVVDSTVYALQALVDKIDSYTISSQIYAVGEPRESLMTFKIL